MKIPPRLVLPAHLVPVAPRAQPTVAEAFAGCGGLSQGLHDAGFRGVWAGEMFDHAANSYAANFPEVPLFRGKIETGDELGAARPDVIAGGFPCQPFSQAGMGLGADDPRDGFPVFIRMVARAQPRAFLGENVKGLTTATHRPYLDAMVGRLRALGYTVDWRVLNAADYGTPQKRQRLILVGFRDAADAARWTWPAPTHSLEGLVWSKWVDGSYWREHGLKMPVTQEVWDGVNTSLQRADKYPGTTVDDPGPTLTSGGDTNAQRGYPGPRVGQIRRATVTKEEQRALDRLEGTLSAPPPTQRWRTVRDAIGDIVHLAGPGATRHSPPVEMPTGYVVDGGKTKMPPHRPIHTLDEPVMTMRAQHAGGGGGGVLLLGSSNMKGAERALYPDGTTSPVRKTKLLDVGHEGERKGGSRGKSVLYKPTLPDLPVQTLQAAAEQQGSEHAMRIALANHDPEPVSPLVQRRIEAGEVDVILRKHPPRQLDSASVTVESNLHRGGYYGLVATPTLRRLTVRECARLQGFPDSFILTGPKTAQYKQVGNAVPRELALAVGHALKKALGFA